MRSVTVVAGRVQDIDPGSTLDYQYALAEEAAGVCQLYLFDQTGTDRVAGIHTNAILLSNGDCGTFLGPNAMTGVRVSRSASIDETAPTSSVKRALKRHGRALRSETRERTAVEQIGAADLFRKLQESSGD